MIVKDPSEYRQAAVFNIALALQTHAGMSEEDAIDLAHKIALELEYTGFDCFREEHAEEGAA